MRDMVVEHRTEPEYWEYLDGEAHPKVSSRRRHAVVQTRLAAIILQAAAAHGQVGTAWDVWLPYREKLTKFIPDVSFFSFERLHALSESDLQFPPFAPDVAVEVWSPGDDRAYLHKKVSLCLSHGALVVLDVDPLERIVRVYDNGATCELHESDAFAHPLVPWLTFDVRDVFRDLDIPKK